MRRKFLLGATVNDEIAFGEVDIYKDGRFSCSFDTIRPFNADEKDLVELAEDFIGCFDKASLYDMCDRFDCSPNNLANELAESMDITEFIDCSLYSEEMYINGNTWMFESWGCGQHDLRKDGMSEIINDELFNLVHKLWDEYHLKTMPAEKYLKLIELIDNNSINEEEWIEDYIKRVYL